MTREPVTREAILAGAIALIAQALVVWKAPLTPEQVAWVQAVLTLGALAWTVLRSRPQVTPLADPRSAAGAPLVDPTKEEAVYMIEELPEGVDVPLVDDDEVPISGDE